MEVSTPVRANVVPPYGHIVVNEKWRDSELVRSIKGSSIKPIFEEHLGVVDFHLSSKTCVLYVSESDLVAGNDYKRRLVKFRNARCSLHGIVVVEKMRLSEQYFPAVQKFVVFELGLSLLPVISQIEASQLITQLARDDGRDSGCNPFLRRSTSGLLEHVVQSLVQHIPGVGRVKALALLNNFPSIQQLNQASFQELELVVGQTTAQHVRSFFS